MMQAPVRASGKWNSLRAFSTSMTMRVFYTMVTAWIVNSIGLFQGAHERVSIEIRDAAKGVNNSRCVGEMAVDQLRKCHEYQNTLDSWYITLYVKHFGALMPTCLFFDCADAYEFATNNTLAWLLWIAVVLVAVVWIVSLAKWLFTFATSFATHAQLSAVDQDQAYYRAHIPPAFRRLIDEPRRINQHALRNGLKPELMPVHEVDEDVDHLLHHRD